MKKGEVGETRSYIKSIAVRMVEFTRAGLLAEVRNLPQDKAEQAFDSMVKRDPEIRMIRRDSKRLGNGQRVWTRVYRFASADQRDEWHKTLAEVGAARAMLAKSQSAAKKPVDGYAPQHFTAPFRAPSKALPDGFPPRFPWDAKMRFYEPIAPIAQLQATLRRPMTREAA